MNEKHFGFMVSCVSALVFMEVRRFGGSPDSPFASSKMQNKPLLRFRQPGRGRGHKNRACHASRMASRAGMIARRREG